MKISADSQYALINRASEYGPQAVSVQSSSLLVSLLQARSWVGCVEYIARTQCLRRGVHTGDTAVGFDDGADRAQVFRTQSVKACHQELLWRRRGQLHCQWERRYVLGYLSVNLELNMLSGPCRFSGYPYTLFVADYCFRRRSDSSGPY